MAGSDRSARRTKRSAASILDPAPDPDAPTIPRTAGATSASAIRAIEEPITRASCSAVSTSAAPRSTMVWRMRMASRSRSVKILSSAETSANPRARQKRLASSSGMPVISATSLWV